MFVHVRWAMRVCAWLGVGLSFGISACVEAQDLMAGLAAESGLEIGIVGDPPLEVDAGRVYDFAPQAFIVSALTPRFEVENLPPWATFNEYRGELTGSPTAADVGMYSNTRICLTDSVMRACLADFTITVNPMPGIKRFATLSWTPPEEREDGSPVSDVFCYLIYSGPSPEQLLPMVSVPLASGTSYTFNDLADGEHFFAVTALSMLGGESMLSDIVSATVR